MKWAVTVLQNIHNNCDATHDRFYSDQLSLAIPAWVDAISTSEGPKQAHSAMN